ncbi:metallophosphoesterase [Bdellovibrio sp. HCB209]|uniref:metallophosphoesterase n=1 Tax=Bdellovibrio sp. HCB209 TaxID=3394354 RepID=UPI0039B472DA
MACLEISRRILVISDLHAPYGHPDTVRFLTALKRKYKFDKVVCVGDEVDYHAISFHDSDPNLPSPAVELQLAINKLKPLYKLFPKVEIVDSNHGSLVIRKALAHGLPQQVFRTNQEILQAPKGWKWHSDYKFNTPLGLVYMCHGKTSSPGKLSQLYGCSTIQGHFHERADITYTSTPEKLIWDMHVGCLADDKSRAMAYNKVNPKRPIISVGIIINGIPQLVPMVLNKRGRWIGTL